MMSKSRNISTLYSFDTEYSADSVEWCPHEPNQNIFVCANYSLLENQTPNEPTKRIGRILLFSITYESGLMLHQTINTAAVLDQKWCHHKINNRSLLGVVNAFKKIEIYKLTNTIQMELLTCYELQDNHSETLILSLDWSTGIYKSDEPEIVCSDSKGNIHLLKLVCNDLKLLNSWHGHNFEAWISSFYYWDPNIFFSGGDDSIFLKFDKRIGNQTIAKNKTHNAGITSLHSNCSKENIIVSGSYDESVRLWDVRNIKSEINSIKMPGPLWRLKWDPFRQEYLLAACMLGGVHILEINTMNKEMKIIGSYYEHKNISYGADWSYLKSDSCKRFGSDSSHIIASCSFYDHLLCISKFILKTDD